MQVVVLNDFSYINGGSSSVALYSAIGLKTKNINVIIFASVGPPMHELIEKDIPVICLNQYEVLKDPYRLRASFQGLWNVKAKREFKKLLDSLDNKETIIHLHGWTKALSSSPVNIAIKKNFKIVVTLHDYFIACPNGGFFNYKKNEPCILRPLSRRCLLTNCDVRKYSHKMWRIGRQLFQKYIGLLPKKVRYFIVVSNFSKNIILPYLPKESKLYHIPNPVHINKIPKIKIERNKAFVYIGRVSKEKGVYLFVKAVKQTGAEGIIIGDGPCLYDLKQRFPFIEYTGWLSSSRIKVFLQRVRALVFPSLCYETQGLVVAEAMALGIPVIVADNCAAREFVIDGVTGLLFKGGDLQDLCKKMTLVKEDKKLVNNLSFNAYQNFWKSSSTLGYHTEELIKVYEQILRN